MHNNAIGPELCGNPLNKENDFYGQRPRYVDASNIKLLAPDKQRFTRYGVIGNYLLLNRFDLVAGAALGSDRSPLRATDVRFGGFFTEIDAQLTPSVIGVYRFDRVDPNRDEEGDAARAHTFSTTVRADDHLYLTGEYQRRRLVDGDKPWAVVVSARFVY